MISIHYTKFPNNAKSKFYYYKLYYTIHVNRIFVDTKNILEKKKSKCIRFRTYISFYPNILINNNNMIK